MNQGFSGDVVGLRCTPPAMGEARGRGRGFTLVELLITMSVAVILIVIAVPSFRNMMLSNKLTTTANEIVGAINTARIEAIKRNANTQFCSNLAASNASSASDVLGTACTTQAGAVVAMVKAAPGLVTASPAGLTGDVQLKGNMQAIRFGGQGLGYVAGTTTLAAGVVADICTSSMSSGNHRLIQMIGGSIITVSTTSGACP